MATIEEHISFEKNLLQRSIGYVFYGYSAFTNEKLSPAFRRAAKRSKFLASSVVFQMGTAEAE